MTLHPPPFSALKMEKPVMRSMPFEWKFQNFTKINAYFAKPLKWKYIHLFLNKKTKDKNVFLILSC